MLAPATMSKNACNTKPLELTFKTDGNKRIRELTMSCSVAELMSNKNKRQKRDSAEDHDGPAVPASSSSNPRREELGAYIAHPELYSPDTVVYYNSEFVAIYDKYPKSSLHLLLLPRDSHKTRLHPTVALQDPDFLAKVKAEASKLRSHAAAELRRRYGKYSAQDSAREKALHAEPPPDKLPPGRDWEQEIMCGIHSHPSMNHLHIHIISKDRCSDRMKHKKHYNSFSTPFFVHLKEFPLTPDSARKHTSHSGSYLHQDLVCWRCGKNFGNKFADLKRHLDEEFDQWKRL